MGAAASGNAAESGNTFGVAALGLAGALTLIASANRRITAPRVVCCAEPVSAAAAAAAAAGAAKAAAAAKAASAAAGAGNAAKAAGAAGAAGNAAKAAGAASGAAKAAGAVAGSAGSSTMYKSGEESDDSTYALESGRKFFPQDRGTPESEEYMRQLRKQKEEAWEQRTARPGQKEGKGNLYDPFMAGEVSWLDSAKEAGLYTGEFNPAFQVGVTEPLGFFDPLGFTKVGDKAGFSKLRAAELKHGRVAMMAAVGAVAQHYIQFPGFKDVPTGLAAINVTPGSYGAIVLFAVSGALELGLWTESPNKEPGNFGDPAGFDQYTEETRNRELNNGRFAMFAVMGIIAAELLTGKDAIEQFGLK